MRNIFALASIAALAACASSPPDGPPPERPARDQQSSKAISAPARDDVALQITNADNGGTVTAEIGTTISVALIGVPTAGYMWAPVEVPPYLEAAGATGGPTSEAQLQPGFSGGSHWEVFFFRVTGEGQGLLRFEQRRPWEEETAPPADEFSVTVAASAG